MKDNPLILQTLQETERELVKFRGCIDSIGTQFDDHENRKEIKRLRSVIKSKVTLSQKNLKSGRNAKDPQSKILHDRLTVQLDTQINTFQSLLDKEKKAVKQNPAPAEGQLATASKSEGGYQRVLSK